MTTPQGRGDRPASDRLQGPAAALPWRREDDRPTRHALATDSDTRRLAGAGGPPSAPGPRRPWHPARSRALMLALLALVLPGAAAAQDASPAGGPDASPAAASTVVPAPLDPGGLPGSRPNVVVVMLDDIPADAMPGLLRDMPRTRALFGDHGLRFEHAFGQDPLCCPGRAGFLTGLTAEHHRVRFNFARRLRPSMTLATALDAVGYRTLLVGKYLNNANQLKDRTPTGWDNISMFGRAGYYGYTLLTDGRREEHGRRPADYSTDVLAAKALRFLRRAPPDEPVFLLFSPMAVHNGEDGGRLYPPTPAPRDVGSHRCDDAGFRRTPAYDERDVSDKPRWIRRLDYHEDPFYTPRGYPLAPVCRALLSVDDAVDRIAGELRRQGRYEDTLFVLIGDNGMGWGDHRRRAKSVPWATPVPLYVSWQRALGDEPATLPTWVQNIDLAPTIAVLAGTTLGPYATGQARPDGVSLVDVLGSRGAVTLPRTALFEDHRDLAGSPRTWRGLRTTDQHPLGLWRYTEWQSGEVELYDLGADPWELQNVAARRPDVVAALAAQLDALEAGLATNVVPEASAAP